MGKGRFGKNWIDQLLSGANLWFMRNLSIRSILLSVRNTFRNKGRLTLTLITLTLGSATFISVFNVRASLSSTVEDMIKWFNCDVMLTLDRTYRADKVQVRSVERSRRDPNRCLDSTAHAPCPQRRQRKRHDLHVRAHCPR